MGMWRNPEAERFAFATGQVGRFTPHSWCRCGGIGRHAALKMLWRQLRVGSTPTSGTTCAGRVRLPFRHFIRLSARAPKNL
jgi:hypothetical protein